MLSHHHSGSLNCTIALPKRVCCLQIFQILLHLVFPLVPGNCDHMWPVGPHSLPQHSTHKTKNSEGFPKQAFKALMEFQFNI